MRNPYLALFPAAFLMLVFAVTAGEAEKPEKPEGHHGHGHNDSCDRCHGRSPFLQAATQGDIKQVKKLLGEGADINEKDNDGFTALHLTAATDHHDVAGFLISNGIKIDARSKMMATPLHIAAIAGSRRVVQLLLDNGAEVNAMSKGGFTPLYGASENGMTEVVKMLLAKGADVSIPDEDGMTPLHMAAAGGSADIIKCLVEGKADINAKDKEGRTPLDLVKDSEAKALLIKLGAVHAKPDPVVALYEAVTKGDLDGVKKAVAAGASVDGRDKNGERVAELDISPLHLAAANGDNQVVAFLVEKGADVNDRMAEGATPIFMAIIGRHLKTVELLLDKGADPNAAGKDGNTPLDWALKEKLKDIAALLRKRGAKTGAEIEAEAAKKSGKDKPGDGAEESEHPAPPLCGECSKIVFTRDTKKCGCGRWTASGAHKMCYECARKKRVCAACGKELGR